MYKIIGTDQKEYGPVSSAQIHQWIAQGRIGAQTRAQSDGGEWKTLGDFPEFTASIGTAVRSLPRPTSNPLPESAPPAKTSGMAIASLVLGILGIVSCGITSLIGLILGIVALIRVNKSNGALRGNGLAIAGIIVSVLLPLFILPAALLLPALAKAKQRALTIQCVNNMKQLSLAARMYSAEHDGHFPAAEKWCDALQPYLGNVQVYRCPAGNPADRCDYAFNSKLAGMDTKNVNPQTVLLFETNPGWNTSGGSELMKNPSRHGRTFVVAFADGHIEQLTAPRLANLRWDP